MRNISIHMIKLVNKWIFKWHDALEIKSRGVVSVAVDSRTECFQRLTSAFQISCDPLLHIFLTSWSVLKNLRHSSYLSSKQVTKVAELLSLEIQRFLAADLGKCEVFCKWQKILLFARQDCRICESYICHARKNHIFSKWLRRIKLQHQNIRGAVGSFHNLLISELMTEIIVFYKKLYLWWGL